MFLHVSNKRSQRFFLSLGRFFQLAVLQKRCDAMYKEPSISVEYKLQFILFYLFEMRRNRFQYSLGIRSLQHIKGSLVLCLNSLTDSKEFILNLLVCQNNNLPRRLEVSVIISVSFYKMCIRDSIRIIRLFPRLYYTYNAP